MSRGSTLVLLGALAILAPFSGLPVAFRTLIAIGLGVAVLGIGVAERSKEQRRLVAAQSAPPAPPLPVIEPAMPAVTHEPLPAASEEAAPAPKRHVPRAPKTISPI